MARRLHRSFSPGKQRLTQWIGPPAQGFVTVATTAAVLVDSGSFEEPLTLMRTRGMVSIRPTSTAATGDFVGAIGMAVVSTEASAAGVASMPEPYTDADWGGWFVWRSFAYAWDVTTDIGRAISSWNMEIDSKAMRKIAPNETVVTIAESFSGAFAIFDGTRFLVKLS